MKVKNLGVVTALFISLALVLQLTKLESGSEVSVVSKAQIDKELKIQYQELSKDGTRVYKMDQATIFVVQKKLIREFTLINDNTHKNIEGIKIYAYPEENVGNGLSLGRIVVCYKESFHYCEDITLSYLDPMGQFTINPWPRYYNGYSRKEIMVLLNQTVPYYERLSHVMKSYNINNKLQPTYNIVVEEGDKKCFGWANSKELFVNNILKFYLCDEKGKTWEERKNRKYIDQYSYSEKSTFTPFPQKVHLQAIENPISEYAYRYLVKAQGIDEQFLDSLKVPPVLP